MAKNNQRVWTMVTIITVILLIIIFSGVTYAYFSAFNNQGSTESISMTSGKMIITYADGKSSLLISKEIHPSDRIIIDKTFTLTGTNTTSGLAMPYKIGIKFKNEFSYNQLYYYIKRVSENENITAKLIGEANQTIPGHETETGYTKGTFIKNSDETYLELANGEFKANTNNQTITFNLKIQFPDNNENQDLEKGKSFTGYIVVNNEEETAVDYIVNVYNQDKENNGLMIDDTEDYNIRYSGSNDVVKNYVEFGNDGELWRIIGIFDVKDNENGEYHKKIKIVRNSPLGGYSYDTSESNPGGNANWSTAKLQYELNGDYLDTTLTSNKTNWYNSYYDPTSKKYIFQQTGVFDYTKVIKKKYQQMISITSWKLPTTDNLSKNVGDIYIDEKNSNQLPNWTGKISLIYATDFVYASTNEVCRELPTNDNCKNNNWLYKGYYWILNCKKNLKTGYYANTTGAISPDNLYNPVSIYPSLYLSPTVKIISGTGTMTNSYKLSL